MANNVLPATEAAVAPAGASERASYEFAFHVLPTVAEGEVAGVFEALKEAITGAGLPAATSTAQAGGEVFDEEAPERIELAYNIEKHSEGKSRTFHSAYFGWVRFRIEPEKLESLTAAIETRADILRYLIVRLTRQEEAAPFRYHEAMKKNKVRTVEEKEIPMTKIQPVKEGGEVSEEKLDESLGRITEDADVEEKSDTIEETEGEKKE